MDVLTWNSTDVTTLLTIMMVPSVLCHGPTNTKEEWLDWQRFRYPSTTYNIFWSSSSSHFNMYMICDYFKFFLHFWTSLCQELTKDVFHTAPQEVLQNWPLCSFAVLFQKNLDNIHIVILTLLWFFWQIAISYSKFFMPRPLE